MSDGFTLRPYEINVTGFPPAFYYASTPARARTKAWRDFTSAWDTTFRDFLKMSSVRRCDPPADFGTPIMVSGAPAFQAGPQRANQVPFVRPGSDQIMLSHEMDVAPASVSKSEEPEK
jgi:hypothetical protein